MTDGELIEKGTCHHCRTKFHRPPSVYRNGYGKYCSRECFHDATRKHPFVDYKNKRFSLSFHGYYVANDGEKLHRRIWTETYGIPPAGCVIHHRDENKQNNELSNLEMMSWGAHTRHHRKGKGDVVVSCAFCGKNFHRAAGKMKRFLNIFCDRHCHMLHRNQILGIRQRTDVSNRLRKSNGTFLPKNLAALLTSSPKKP